MCEPSLPLPHSQYTDKIPAVFIYLYKNRQPIGISQPLTQSAIALTCRIWFTKEKKETGHDCHKTTVPSLVNEEPVGESFWTNFGGKTQTYRICCVVGKLCLCFGKLIPEMKSHPIQQLRYSCNVASSAHRRGILLSSSLRHSFMNIHCAWLPSHS